MSHYENLKAIVGNTRAFGAPLSPAERLDLVVGFDDDGYEIFQLFAVGQLVISELGRLYRIAGFTKANTIICKPHGLGHDPAIGFIEFESQYLRSLPESDDLTMHSNGLVIFSSSWA